MPSPNPSSLFFPPSFHFDTFQRERVAEDLNLPQKLKSMRVLDHSKAPTGFIEDKSIPTVKLRYITVLAEHKRTQIAGMEQIQNYSCITSTYCEYLFVHNVERHRKGLCRLYTISSWGDGGDGGARGHFSSIILSAFCLSGNTRMANKQQGNETEN